MRRMIAAFLFVLTPPSVSFADFAYLLTDTVCQNQADSMDFAWSKAGFAAQGNPKLFYFDGTDIKPVGHTDSFDSFTDVVVSAHGAAGTIAGKSAGDFADIFKGKHNSTPTAVNFMVCNSASVPPLGGLSVVGALAAKYPESIANTATAIGTLSGATAACKLRRPDEGPATKIGDAVYREAAATSAAGKVIATELVAAWSTDNYPNTATSFEDYCPSALADLQKLPDFLATVDTTYGARYLDLINENSGGAPLYSCGKNTATPVCQ